MEARCDGVLSRILVYPIKSLPAYCALRARVLPSGALQQDRRWAIVDAAGTILTAKRSANFHRLRLESNDGIAIALETRDSSCLEWFQLDRPQDRQKCERWLSDFFQSPLQFVEETTTGLPDDPDSPGPTLVSAATLTAVASWFPGLNVDDVRGRFRANLEFSGVPPFWEDRLVGPEGEVVEVQIGKVRLFGTNPCQRCVVPSRSPTTGEVWPEFAKRFSQEREANLPEWATRSRFNHFYRLSVNTRGDGQGGTIQVGDPVRIIGR